MRSSAGCRYSAVISLYSAHTGTAVGPLVYSELYNLGHWVFHLVALPEFLSLRYGHVARAFSDEIYSSSSESRGKKKNKSSRKGILR